MSHNFLLEIYSHIRRRQDEIERIAGPGISNHEEKCFLAGRAEILNDINAFLADRFNRKLPRRIYNQLRKDS